MELDLDSFLNSPLTSDDDDDDDDNNLNSIPRRTIDEILDDDTVSVSTTKQPSSDFSLKPLPSLFRGVRSNAKPGAALAVAVAASRALPTPHAAAIKLRRAAFQKVLENSDAVSVSASASDAFSSNSEIRNAKEDEVLEGVIGNEDGLKVSSNHEELLQTSVEEDENNVNVDENASVLDRSSEILNSEEDKVDHLESTFEALETQQQVNVLKDTEVGGVGGGGDDDC